MCLLTSGRHERAWIFISADWGGLPDSSSTISHTVAISWQAKKAKKSQLWSEKGGEAMLVRVPSLYDKLYELQVVHDEFGWMLWIRLFPHRECWHWSARNPKRESSAPLLRYRRERSLSQRTTKISFYLNCAQRSIVVETMTDEASMKFIITNSKGMWWLLTRVESGFKHTVSNSRCSMIQLHEVRGIK